MRRLDLLRIAAEAESLRLRRRVARTVVQIAMAAAGAGFLAVAFAFLHVAVWYYLRIDVAVSQAVAAVIIAGGDVVVALLLILIAAQSGRPGRVEREALEVRRRAVAGATSTVALATLLMPLVQFVLRMLRRRD